LFYPVLFGIQRLSDYIASPFTKKKKRDTSFSEEELKTALILGKKEGQITEAEEILISYILKFKDTTVSQIMTPRVEIQAIDIEDSQNTVLKALKEKHHSRFPVYKESPDNIGGILYSKDIFLDPHKDWRNFLRDPLFFPESKKIGDILKVFIEKKLRIAIIIDEYGGTAGLVTFEDIIEEIFGEIYDEYEHAAELIEEIGERTYRVLGKTPIKTINLELQTSIPEDEDTLAGFLLSQLERVPSPNERFNFNDIAFVIEKASRKRLLSVIIKTK
jgi:CBS domain containing-hemolysin-like protein